MIRGGRSIALREDRTAWIVSMRHPSVVYSTRYASVYDSPRRGSGYPHGRLTAQAVSGSQRHSDLDSLTARLCLRAARDGDLRGGTQTGDGARSGPNRRI